MRAFRALKRCVPVTAGVVALTLAGPAALAEPAPGGTIPRLGRTVPAVGGNIGDVFTTTCGNSAVIVLAVVVCEAQLPAARLTRQRQRATRPVPAANRLQQIATIADSSGFDWRRAGVVLHAQYHPEECCAWGVYDFRDNSIWIGPTAFANPARLRYTVLHEIGHAWQWSSGQLDRLKADMAPFGRHGLGAIEAGADCVSVVWGVSPRSGHYWACPPAAARLVARRLAGDWSP